MSDRHCAQGDHFIPVSQFKVHHDGTFSRDCMACIAAKKRRSVVREQQRELRGRSRRERVVHEAIDIDMVYVACGMMTLPELRALQEKSRRR